MLQIRLIGVLLITLLLAAPANAARNASFPVNWPQNSINWNQLQTVFAQNPNYSQFNIRFPNGYNWNINAASLQAFYNTYTKQTGSLGMGTNAPQLAFSPLISKPSVANGGIMLPVNAAMSTLQEQSFMMLNELNYQKYYLAQYLPDWLKKIISLIYIGLGSLYDFAVSEIKKLF